MTSIRKQLADTLRYIRRERLSDYDQGRQEVEVSIESMSTSLDNVTLSALVQGMDSNDYDKVFIRGYQAGSSDWDGYPEGYVELYTYRKETDQEYFDRICQEILPTEYQQKQYRDYLRLKQLFEKDQS